MQLKTLRTERINQEIPRRNQLLDDSILQLTAERNAAQRTYDSLNIVYSANPVFSKQELEEIHTPGGVDENGNPKPENVTKRAVTKLYESPLKKQVDHYQGQVEQLDNSIAELQKGKLQTADSVRTEFEQAKAGFLEELHAVIDVISSEIVAMFFYLVLFAFLLMLELLVVTTKTKDANSDYDMIIEHQLKIKERSLKETENYLLNTTSTQNKFRVR